MRPSHPFRCVRAPLDWFPSLVHWALRFWLRLSGEGWRIARSDLPRVALLGLIGITLYQVCFILGISLTTAGNG